MIPTLPLRPRNRLAETILAALHDSSAREELTKLANASGTGVAREWLSDEEQRHSAALVARARRAADAVAARRVPDESRSSIARLLDDAATLFDAGLYFEVHELLEPSWREAEGAAREALQGLIQIAVGYQHLANGNVAGARALLDEGAERLRHGRLPGLDVGRFASDVSATCARVPDVDEGDVPAFPRVAVAH